MHMSLKAPGIAYLRIAPLADGGLAYGDRDDVQWLITGYDKHFNEVLRGKDTRDPYTAGLILHGLYAEHGEADLIYHDAIERSVASSPDQFGDDLSTLMWSYIEQEHDLPDHPEEYVGFADGHPLDQLRTGFLEAAKII